MHSAVVCPDGCHSVALQLLIYGLGNGAVVALSAVGFTLAYAAARQLNLAHGNVFALTTVLVASLARAVGLTPTDPPLARIGLVAFFAKGAYTTDILTGSGSRLAPLLPSVVTEPWLAAQSAGVDLTQTRLLAFAIGAAYAGVAGAIYASLHGHVEPEQFDLTLSLMVLAAVVIGGQWGLFGVVLGALGVALYDRVVVDSISTALRVHGVPVDLRDHNFAVFGVALYLAILLRARGGGGCPLPSVALGRFRLSLGSSET